MAPGHFGYPIGDFYVYGWSISGNETAVGVKTRGLFVLFDVGIAPTWSISAKHVFISHGHIDHIGAICQHMRKRELNNIGSATYYLLPHLIEPVKVLCRAYSELQGRETVQMYEPKFVEMIAGSRIQIEHKWWVESFQTDHVVQSLGYLIFRQDFNTGELIPEIAYTGDTRFTIYTLPAHPKLLQVKLLISESTYLEDNERSREYSQKYGHICITDFAINSRLFRQNLITVIGHSTSMDLSRRPSKFTDKDVNHCSTDIITIFSLRICFVTALVDYLWAYGLFSPDPLWSLLAFHMEVGAIFLIHFSDRYNLQMIKNMVYGSLPKELAEKIYCSLAAKKALKVEHSVEPYIP